MPLQETASGLADDIRFTAEEDEKLSEHLATGGRDQS